MAFTEINITEGGFKPIEIETTPTSGFRPIKIEPIQKESVVEVAEPEIEKNQILETGKDVAKFIGEEAAATGELAMSLASGALLWPFSKVWGTLNLPWGADAAKRAEEEVQKFGYQPFTEEGKAAVNLIGKGFDAFLTPSKMAEESMAEFSPRAAYLIGFGSELAQFAMTGAAVRGVNAKVKGRIEKPKATELVAKEESLKEDIAPKKEVVLEDIAEHTKDLPLFKEEGFKEVPIEEPVKTEFKEMPIEEPIGPKAETKKYYHGTGQKFDKFEGVSYFTENKKAASRYAEDYKKGGRVIEVDLSLKNKATEQQIREKAETMGKKTDGIETYELLWDKELIKELEKDGFDGGEFVDDYKGKFKTTVSFDPKNIKQKSTRTIKDITSDINDLLGERGEIGDASLSPKQEAALNRLKNDANVAKKTVEELLLEMKVDPKVAALMGQKVTELKKFAGSINLEKQDIPRELKEFETVIQEPKKVQTWGETTGLSKELRSDYKKAAGVLEKAKKGDALTAVEIDATRQMNVNAMANLKEILETNPERFQEQYSKYKTDLFDTLSNASSEAGRALNIHKKEVSISRLTNAFSKLKRGLNPRELKEFKELNLENPIEVKNFMNRLGDPKLSDYFVEYWYNSILSGPPTHIVNAVGNTAWQAYQVPHRLASAAVDLPYSKLTGKPRTRYMNEILPMLLGMKTGFLRGKKLAGQTLRHGRIQEFETKWAQEMQSAIGAFERSPHKILRKVAPLITAPTRALRAMDAWANAMGYDAAARSMARRESNAKGLTGKERAVAENKFVENLTAEQHKTAMARAKHFTFMDDPDPLTSTIIKARNIPVVGTTMKLTILPFVNTISNLMKRGAELTPGVGLVKEAISRGMGRGKNTPEVIAKQIEGAVIATYVWDKINKDEITGSMPESKTERESWYRQGKLPYSIKHGDTWISYRRAEPYNTVIASAHSAYEAALGAESQDEIDDIFFDVANRMKNNVIDGSYFQGLQAVMNRHQKSKGAVARWSSSWVPYSSFFRSMSRAYEVATEGNAKAREAGNEYQKAFSQVLPWLIDKPPAKLDVWGEESVLPGGIFRQWLPFKWVKEGTDPVEKELESLGFYPAVPTKKVKINGVDTEFDDDIYKKYVQTFGARAKKRMMAIVTNPDYQRVALTGKRDKQHKARIKRNITKIKISERRRAIREQRLRNKEK